MFTSCCSSTWAYVAHEVAYDYSTSFFLHQKEFSLHKEVQKVIHARLAV